MAKSKNASSANQLDFFAPKEEAKQTVSETKEAASSSLLEKADPTACPKCGGKSLVSARPREMGGARYCPQCPGAEPGECFYFTPSEATVLNLAVVHKSNGNVLLKESPHKPYYQENGITLYHGDCREILMWLAPQSADLAITDPPYGVSYDGNPDTPREELKGDHSAELYRPVLKFLTTRCKSHAALYLFYADGDAAVLAAGFEVRNTLIWNKNNAQGGALSAQYKQKHEPFLYCHLKGEAPQWFGKNNETTVWNYDRANRNEFHPTQKPVDLLKHAIKNSSKEGDLILDPFAGSGSILVAAKNLNRRAIGIEIEERYCEIAAKRLSQSVLEF